MPALNMKAKLSTTCKRDETYFRVSQKSNKIAKVPCSKVRVTPEPADLNTLTQTPKNGEFSDSGINAVSSWQSFENFNCSKSIDSAFIIELDCLL